MNYKDAKATALELRQDLNRCREYEKAYHFYKKSDEEVVGDFDVVILKSNGKAITFTQFILKYKPELNPKEIDF